MTQSTSRPRWTFFLALALATVALRLAPQWIVRLQSNGFDMASVKFPWGFTTAIAVGLFAGARIRNLPQALGLTLGIQLVGDLLIGLMAGDLSQGLTMGLIPVYISYTLIALLGRPLGNVRLDKASSWFTVGGASLLAPTLFFVLTNLAVWAAPHAGVRMYPTTLSGLLDCFVAAIPFSNYFVPTVVGTFLLFSPLGISLATKGHEIAPANDPA